MNGRFDRWCKTAVDQIRYSPDRKAVYNELYAHLEDRYEAELERWDEPREAEEAVLRAMGSATELAPQLAAIHRPFWGYALSVTRWMLCFALLLLVLDLVVFVGSNRGAEAYVPWFYERPGEDLTNFWEDGAGKSVRVLDYDPDAADSSDGFQFDVTRAVMVFSDYDAEDEQDCYYFWFRIEVRSILQWSQLHEIPIHDFHAIDSLGNTYCSYHDDMASDTRAVSGNLQQNGPFSYTMDMWLNNFCSQDAQWVEICYDRDGRDIRLRIDLTGGGAA